MNERILEAAGPLYVVFSDDWGEHMSSSQHLFQHIAREHPVIWMNTIGMRPPRLNTRDLVKIWRKLSRMCLPDRRMSRSHSAGPNVTVCQPPMLPYSRIGVIRRFNTRIVKRTLRSRVDGISDKLKVTLVATVPNAGDYCDALPNARVVYYCVDDFTKWPGFDADLVCQMEQRLIERADVLIAASQTLCDRLAVRGKPVYLLTHGVDVDHFGRAASVEHHCLTKIPKPRVGFFGVIDNRVDQRLLNDVARRMPNISFVFAGPVEAPVAELAKCSNVHFPGVVPYLELPAFVSGIDALLIPYKTDALGNSLSPLKLREYLVTGKPVVSTPIAEAIAHPDYVAVASDVDDWVRKLRSAVDVDVAARRSLVSSAMQGESWSHKARLLAELCSGRSAAQMSSATVGAV